MKHIVFYSGGIGSWMTAKRVIAQHGKENVILLFTDTLIEDEDLYRFINETVKEMDVQYEYIADGRTPWEVFKDVKYLGNSRLAQCSHVLKQKPADKWIKANYKPDECLLYLGIDWSEAHRVKSPTKNWLPYTVLFPMCEEPYLTKQDMLDELQRLGIEIPKLYKLGFSHNNCGGGCVRAGQGHFVNLLKQLPFVYQEWEVNEQQMRDFLDKDVSMLRRTKKGERTNLTLKKLREEVESDQKEQIDMFDIGGCGCFSLDDDAQK
ncbi:MAG TPA: hypothetical protein VI423_01890 [Paenisporosarcina sp.]|nr:hypothetical protein [Paenisporosarcina sp.]